MKVKEESEKAGLKLNIQKTNMASDLITSWQIEGGKWKQWQIFLSSQITEDSDCSHEIKRCFFPGGKAMTNLDSRDIKKASETLLCQQWSV